MKNNIIVLKRILITQIIAIFGYLIVILLLTYAIAKYTHFKGVGVDIILILILIEFFRLLTPVLLCPIKIVLDKEDKKITVLYPFNIDKKEVLLDEIWRIEFNWKKISSIVKDPKYNITIYLTNKENVKICLLLLRKYGANKYTRTKLYTLYLFIYFFEDLFTKNNKEAIFKELRSWLYMSKRDIGSSYFNFFVIEKILRYFNMTLEEFVKQENRYDEINWEEYYKFREEYKNNRMFE